ncbi:hypothetical protein CLAFUW4_05933 [Fulvia fulva]|uniref:Uncharacterized protein n=1 Tax=Passalora fulva TaxID=5499 RepID=A0A9Q8LH04_PASFU|nr:uncharacterized protein CLAFUR5_06077 [Fulvia fulva]KAK4624464.1 hypothetical protein CLAFUR4_05938 [Fulvia fulva]KAK4625208.1 hypothetical protein CLAFUR0_05940 [Fulvia fulva]UJO17232.1 hypothetical protein CLAFUR5_06077 [Fulvia fulva]WPV15601.1 hypothetical protein CLAFUW4_05933 [Fulvia fulva]WPV29451.1 hypothetical protein CLAFUW7_05931 [Fulvia fulva]
MAWTYADVLKFGPFKPHRKTFFDLSLEIRQQIYELLTPHNHEFKASNTYPYAPEDRYARILTLRRTTKHLRQEMDDWLSKTCGAYFYLHDEINLDPDEVLYAPPLALPYGRLRYVEIYIDCYNHYGSSRNYDECSHMWYEGDPSEGFTEGRVYEQRKQLQDVVTALKRFEDLPILYVRFRDEDNANHREMHRSRRYNQLGLTWCEAQHCLAAKSFANCHDAESYVPKYILDPLLELPVCAKVIVQPLHLTDHEGRSMRSRDIPQADQADSGCRAQEYVNTPCTAYERWIEGERSEAFESCWRDFGSDWQRGEQDRLEKLETLKQAMPSARRLR